MARTLKNLRDEIIINLGGRDDADSLIIINSCVNAAIEAVCLYHDLPAGKSLGRLTYSTGVDELLIATSAKLMDVVTATNETDDIEMGFLKLEDLDRIVPSGSIVRFYSRDGDAILVRPTPTKETTVLLRYSTYPSRLTLDAETLPYEGHDGLTASIATTIAWASFEEVDSSTLWAKISEILMLPSTEAMRARQQVAGVPIMKEVKKWQTQIER